VRWLLIRREGEKESARAGPSAGEEKRKRKWAAGKKGRWVRLSWELLFYFIFLIFKLKSI
jgi:hypothetical protein